MTIGFPEQHRNRHLHVPPGPTTTDALVTSVQRAQRRAEWNRTNRRCLVPLQRAERGEFLTGAKVDTSIVVVYADRARLLESLSPFGLTIEPVEGVPADQHPLLIETFNTSESWGAGRDLLGHTWTNHDLAKTTGATAGALGWGSVGALGGPLGAVVMAKIGARVGGKIGDLTSRAVTGILGNPDEAMVLVPNAKKAGARDGEGQLYMAMPGMHTNRFMADAAEALLGFGMHKRISKVRGDHLGFVVEHRARPALKARYHGGASDTDLGCIARSLAFSQVFEALRTQPILGHVKGSEFAVSVLKRYTYADRQHCPCEVARARLQPTRSRRIRADLELTEGFMSGIRPGPRSAEGFQVFGLETALTMPTRLHYDKLP